MSAKNKKTKVSRIKTGKLERRMSLASTGVLAGTRAATHMWVNMLNPADKRKQRQKEIMAEQTQYVVEELGKLKGSVVKIGQVMATYGQHILPEEISEALHALEEQTAAVEWPVIEQVLLEQLGEDRFAQLDIEQDPIGAASLGQVHRAVHRGDGRQICLKVQYPGVAEAVDSDLDAVVQILRWARLINIGKDFQSWLEEVREMLHREIDYGLEAITTNRFRALLVEDDRFVVPEVYFDFSSPQVLALSYESGYSVSDSKVAQLPQHRRDNLGRNFLDLFLKEVFVWEELQTDPNFGNYRIRPALEEDGMDKIVLLDFGAVQAYPDSFISPVKAMVSGAYQRDITKICTGAVALNMMRDDYPDEVHESFAQLCIALVEPMNYEPEALPEGALNEQGVYRWQHSQLPKRVAKQAAKSAFSKYFAAPPKEFTFLSRKLLGVFSFIAVLDAEFNGKPVLERFVS